MNPEGPIPKLKLIFCVTRWKRMLTLSIYEHISFSLLLFIPNVRK